MNLPPLQSTGYYLSYACQLICFCKRATTKNSLQKFAIAGGQDTKSYFASKPNVNGLVSSFICQLAITTLSEYFKYFAYCFSSMPLDSQSSTLIKTTQTEGRSGMV